MKRTRTPPQNWRQRHKRKVQLGVLAVGVVLLGIGARSLARKLSFFAVRRVEVVGAQYLDAQTAAAALRLEKKASIFDPTGQWVARIKALPGVQDASISRRLPGTLRIRVEEVEPVALAEQGNRLVLVDEAGSVLPFNPARPAADLPLAPADSVVTGVLSLVRDIAPDLYARVQRGVRIRNDVALELEEGRLFLRAGADAADIQAVSLVADLLTREGRTWGELDGRYLPRVIVRKAGSA